MSLGLLTADYGDSDIEDEPQSEHKFSKKRLSSSSAEFNLSNQDKPSNKIPQEEEQPKAESPDDRVHGLSGVIIDDDEDIPSPAAPTPPNNLRVGELRATGGNSASPSSNTDSGSSNRNTPVKKINKLVSYDNEEDVDDSESEEEPDEVLHSEPMDTGTDGEDDSNQPLSSVGSSHNPSYQSSPSAHSTSTSGAVVVNGIKLPSAPNKKCSQALQDKVIKALAQKRRGMSDYNKIQNKKEFRNPSIYEKLVDLLRLDENGTNYPVSLYDPHCWGKESYYEELARAQKEEMEKREKERKDKTKVDIVSGTKKQGEEETKKRKSRFDAARPEGGVSSVAKPIGLMTTLPNSIATKTTIDAFGGLNKKMKT